MIKPLNTHYSFNNPASVYDEESLTALELAGRQGAKINEVVKDQNQLVENTNKKLDAQDRYNEETRDKTVPEKVVEEFENNLENGTFEELVNNYAGDLTQRLNNLLGAVKEGSTTLDAEVIDLRMRANNVVYDNAGEAMRSLDVELNELKMGRCNLTYALDWVGGFKLSHFGRVEEASNPKYAVAKITLPKGCRIVGKVYSTESSGAMAIGTPEQCLSTIVKGGVEGEPTNFSYVVKEETETIYIMTDTQKLATTSIMVSLEPVAGLGWTRGYFSESGEMIDDILYAISDPIYVPAFHEITAYLQASTPLHAIVETDANGVFIQNLLQGRDGTKRYDYTFPTNKGRYVRLTTRINKAEDDKDTTYFNDVEYVVTPCAKKHRVPSFTVGNGHINVESSNVRNDSYYKYSNMIKLYPGETIRFHGAGTASMWLLSEWDNKERTFVQGLVKGDNRYHLIEYTNDRDTVMWLRTSAKVVANSANEPIITETEFTDVKVFFKEIYYADVKTCVLYGKKITTLGDSLMAGNKNGKDSVWVHHLAQKYNMIEDNQGVNGNTVAVNNVEPATPMCERVQNIGETDYFVLIGGANDLRLNVPLGDVTSTDTSTFCGALNTIIDTMRTNSPKTKMLFLTNMNRFGTTNAIGVKEEDYVTAMMEVCRQKCVPCFDNYHDLGIYFRDVNQSAWSDEGRELSLAYTGADDPETSNKHLSREGYKWVLNRYENLLLEL